jgi:pimeloyl-ACP methyl ester carboxylesterase
MLTATPVHPEGPRYGTSIVFLSGLWVSPMVWRPVASFLAHRGWPGALLDVRAVAGGVAARADPVAGYVRALSAPPVMIGHDAGALVALAAAARAPVRALALVSSLVPGAPGTHGVAWSRRLPWSLFRRAPVAAPSGPVGAAFFAGLPDQARDETTPEDPRLLAELARRSHVARPATMPPALVLRGAADPIVSHDDARGLAAELGADFDELPDHGHWLPAASGWQECVQRLHRWLVQRLGESELEFYAEAMAERDDADPEP